MSTPKNADYKQAQALARDRASMGTLLVPTLPERINRLRPSERYELGTLLKSMTLRKIIKRTLAEAFWNGQAAQVHAAQTNDAATMQQLRAAVRTQESMKSYERALTSFEPVVLQSQQPTLIEVPR